MNQNRTILRQWLGAVLGAVIIAAAVPATAWGQETPVQQGVRAGSNITTVNGTDVTTGDITSAGRETTVTITTTDRTGESTPKVAKVTVTKKEDFLASSATITGSETVNKNGTVTLTATVTPSFANTVVWTVTAGTGSAEFVTGETTTAATVTAVVDPETGQATATLKGLEPGEVTVNVAATTSTTGTPISAEAKTMTVLNPATITSAPTAVSKVVTNTVMALCTAGTAENGTMMYALSSSNTTAPAASSFSATLPKASSLSAGSNYYVWYYVKANEGYADSEKGVTSSRASVVNGSSAMFNEENIQGNSTTIGDITLEATTQSSSGSYFVLFNPGQTVTLTALNSKTIYNVTFSSAHIPSYSCNPSCNNNSPYDNVHYLTNNSTGIIGPTLTITNTSTNNGTIDEFMVWYY